VHFLLAEAIQKPAAFFLKIANSLGMAGGCEPSPDAEMQKPPSKATSCAS
jgi:hypothetical protein